MQDRTRRWHVVLVMALLPVTLVLARPDSAAAAESFTAKGSVEQVYVTGLQPGATVTLHESGGSEVASREASSLGGSLFREVPAGSGYTVRSGGVTSDDITVLPNESTPPSTSVY